MGFFELGLPDDQVDRFERFLFKYIEAPNHVLEEEKEIQYLRQMELFYEGTNYSKEHDDYWKGVWSRTSILPEGRKLLLDTIKKFKNKEPFDIIPWEEFFNPKYGFNLGAIIEVPFPAIEKQHWIIKTKTIEGRRSRYNHKYFRDNPFDFDRMNWTSCLINEFPPWVIELVRDLADGHMTIKMLCKKYRKKPYVITNYITHNHFINQLIKYKRKEAFGESVDALKGVSSKAVLWIEKIITQGLMAEGELTGPQAKILSDFAKGVGLFENKKINETKGSVDFNILLPDVASQKYRIVEPTKPKLVTSEFEEVEDE